MPKTPCYLWVDSSGEYFKAYLTASFQTRKLSFRHQVTSVDVSLHVSPFALHFHWLARHFWILSLFSIDIGWYIIHFIPLPIFGIPWCCSQLSTDKYLRHIRICLRVIYLPSYQGCLIQGCSTYNHLENFEFENIVRQPPTHVSLYVLTFVTWIHLRHDSSNTTKIPFHRPMPDTRHRVAVATSTKSPDHHGNTISCFWFV